MFNKSMEDKKMTLAKLSNSMFPSVPSLLDRFFEGEMMDWGNRNYAAVNTTLPSVNIKENDHEFIIEVAAPGMKKKDFTINYDNGRLDIASEVKEEKEGNTNEYITRKEFSYCSFKRSFRLGENIIDADGITAGYEQGILNIRLPKREEVKPKPAKEIRIN